MNLISFNFEYFHIDITKSVLKMGPNKFCFFNFVNAFCYVTRDLIKRGFDKPSKIKRF